MRPTRPVLLLVLVSLLSLGARAALLGDPCHARCRRSTDHLLVFDEVYYVNAARVIAGIHPPRGANYAGAPLGDDPNSEHPQGVKLLMAGAIELFGDGPFAWRIVSLLAGSLAILGMWVLARAAGGGEWVAFGAAALMAADDLLLVAGRIGTLDIAATAAMVWALALYLRRRPVAAGAILALGIAGKEVAVYGLLVALAWELLAARRAGIARSLPDRAAVRRLAGFAGVSLLGFVALLAIMDQIAPPWDPQTGHLVAGGVVGHVWRIIRYGSTLSSPRGPQGIASYPWEWLVDFKPIVYLSINPSHPAQGLRDDHPTTLFLGMVSPPILLAGLAALWFGARRAFGPPARTAEPADRCALGTAPEAGLAWFLGTWLPFEALSLLLERTSYLYYMVVVMPGLYLGAGALAVRLRGRRRWLWVWIAAVVLAAVIMYPFDPVL